MLTDCDIQWKQDNVQLFRDADSREASVLIETLGKPRGLYIEVLKTGCFRLGRKDVATLCNWLAQRTDGTTTDTKDTARPMNHQTCANCRYTRRNTVYHDEKGVRLIDPAVTLDCHRFPPVTNRKRKVPADDWCGEWKTGKESSQ